MKQAIQGVASKSALAITAALLKFMCLGDPQDGDVLLYLPFDGDMDTVACVSENAGSTVTGTPVYDDDVYKMHVAESGDPTVTARQGINLSGLKANKSVIRKTITHPYMSTADFNSATIEFFMKGSSNDADVTTWENKLSIGDGSRCGLMVQASNSKQYYVKIQALLQIVENQFSCIAATRPNTALAL